MQAQSDNQRDNKLSKKSQMLPATNQQISEDLQAPIAKVPRVDIKTPSIAEDTDLIEKEWVDKAKEIVEKTRASPYKQQEELAKMKADYLKKRYNREIRSLDDQE
jgi:Txe/YoeB family toxin of Txe-Axe toxin-antitoxin module